MSNYVVTGGAGFIGSHIVNELVLRDNCVTIIDDLSTGKMENIAELGARVTFIADDLSDVRRLSDIFVGVDYVIHQAAIASVPKSVIDPLTSHNANVTATLNVLQAARDSRVKRVVYASSSALYGDDPTLPKQEDMMPDPVSPYGAQKLFAEMYCRMFTRVFGLETVSLRYFNVFGPKQDPSSQYSGVLALFIPSILASRRPTIFGDGHQSRDFTYVQNIVEANLLACTTAGIAGEFFNIACGIRISLNEIVRQINQITGKEISPVFAEARAGDIRHSQAEISKAQIRLGYMPKITFVEGLQKTIDWYAGLLNR